MSDNDNLRRELDAINLRLDALLSHIGWSVIDGTHPDSILGRLERIEEAEERFNHVSHLLSILGPLIAVGMCSILQKKAPWAVKADARDLLAFARDVANAEPGAIYKEKHGKESDELP